MDQETILDKSLWLRAAVQTLLDQIDAPTLQTIVAVGRDEFVRHATSQWSGHGFTQSDFRTAFRMLEVRAEQVGGPTGVSDAPH
tara:strand:- start:3294 stop:3545 length:252 start_codon:yes stop_codon:yes gene_type:complete